MRITFIVSVLVSIALAAFMARAEAGEPGDHVHDPDAPMAEHDGSPVTVNENEVVFEVHGIVCSFCSKGVEKKLSKLPFVDRSKYRNGVFVEIEKQRVTAAIKPGHEVDVQASFDAIRSGGYDPVRVYIAAANGELKVVEAKIDN